MRMQRARRGNPRLTLGLYGKGRGQEVRRRKQEASSSDGGRAKVMRVSHGHNLGRAVTNPSSRLARPLQRVPNREV